MSEKLSDRTARDIAEWYAQNNHPAKSAERKLAKVYLDVINAKPVAEVVFISKLFEGVTCVSLPCKTELKVGDKLYLRKE